MKADSFARGALLILKLELRSLFGINILRHTRDKTLRRRTTMLAVAFAILGVVALGYSAGYGYLITYFGGDALPLLIFASSMIVFILGIFRVREVIFGVNGYDLLASMPLERGSIVVGRLAHLYLEGLGIGALVMIPGGIASAIVSGESFGFFVRLLVSCFILPMIPLAAASFVGTIIAYIALRLKRKALAESIITVAFVVVILVGASMLSGLDPALLESGISSIIAFASVLAARIYPISVWLAEGGVMGAIACVISLALLAIPSVVITASFDKIIRSMNSRVRRMAAPTDAPQQRSLMSALVKRESRLYFSSSIYVTNTIIGPILATVMSASLLVVGVDKLISAVPAELNILPLIPVAIGGVMSMANAASTSISIEGRRAWIIMSLPLTTREIVSAKLAFNLLLTLPFYIISEIFLVLALHPTAPELVWMILIPAILFIFSAVAGIFTDLHLHNFNWDKEEVAVKQSASAFVGAFVGIVAALVSAAPILLVPEAYGYIAMLVICIIFATAAAVLLKLSFRVKIK